MPSPPATRHHVVCQDFRAISADPLRAQARKPLAALGLAAICAISAGLAGAPATAEVVSCGGVGDGAPWLGGTRAASDIATATAPLARASLAVEAGTRGTVLFTLSRPGDIRVEAAPADDAGDTVLELFDAQGTLVVIDDDSGGGLSSRAEPALLPGDYCLAVTGFSGTAVTADVQVSRTEMPALTPGLSGGFADSEGGALFVGVQPCTADTPAIVLGQGAIDASLSGPGQTVTATPASAPYYRFTLGGAQALSILTEGGDAVDPYLYLFDGSGRLLAENDDFDGLDSRIDLADPLPPGDYCVAVRALDNAAAPVTLRVTGFSVPAASAEAIAAGEAAPPLDGSTPVTALGVIATQVIRDVAVPGAQAQWFVADVPEDGILLVTAQAVTESDPVVSVFDASGRMLGVNDDAGETLDSELTVRVAPGRYLIAVRQFSETYEGTIRLGVQRFVPAP